ncbi:tudor domain-containing protein 1-like [Glandiceps talaboti]
MDEAFSIPDTPPVLIKDKLQWPSARAHLSPSSTTKLKLLVDNSCAAQPRETYRMPFLGATQKSQSGTSPQTTNSSPHSDEENSIASWNPMKDDFMCASFNSYDNGPGANLTGAGAPRHVLQAAGDKTRLIQHQVYVTGIPREMKKEAVYNIFSRAGNVTDLNVIATPSSGGVHRGDATYGFITYNSVQEVENAIRILDGFRINDFTLKVKPALSKEERERRKVEKQDLDPLGLGLPTSKLRNGRDGSNNGMAFKPMGGGMTRSGSNSSIDSASSGGQRSPATSKFVSSQGGSPFFKNERNGITSNSLDGKTESEFNARSTGDIRHVVLKSDEMPNAATTLQNREQQRSPKTEGFGRGCIPKEFVKPKSPSSGDEMISKCPRPCSYCKKAGKKWCGRCRTPYCSDECQRLHWPEHKSSCKRSSDSQSVAASKSIGSPQGEIRMKEEILLVNRLAEQSKPMKMTCAVASKVELPYEAIPKEPSFEVFVPVVESPSNFWCQILQEANVVGINKLMLEMNQFYGSTSMEAQSGYKPKDGEIFAAQYSDDKQWYRARMKNVSPDGSVLVLFVDFGNEESMPTSRLRKLPDEMKQLPLQALKCCLAGIEPTNIQSGWSGQAIDIVKQNMLERKCQVQYEKAVDGCHYLWVSDQSDDAKPGSTVNELLISSHNANPKSSQTPTSPNLTTKRQPLMAADIPVKQVPKNGHFSVVCTHLENPGSFYLKIVDQDDLKDLSDISNKMNAMCRETTYNAFQPEVGEVVCAFFNTDNMWHRAVVKEVSGDKVQVQYSDFGKSEVIEKSFTKECHFACLPMQAIHCALAGITVLDEDKGWGRSAIELFTLLVEEKSLGARVVDIIDSKYYVELYNLETNKRMHHELIKAGLGKAVDTRTKCEIPKVSKPLKLPLPLEADKLKMGSTVTCNISYLDSPDEMWIQQAENGGDVFHLQEDLHLYYSKQQAHQSFMPVVGKVCAAKFSVDGHWYRGVITCIGNPNPQYVTVFYFDFGNSETLDVCDLRPLAGQFLKLNAQAIHCSLAGVNTNKWIKEVTQRLKKDVEGELAEVHVVDKVDGVFKVQIFRKTDSKISFNELMIQEGLALPTTQTANESVSCKSADQQAIKGQQIGHLHGHDDHKEESVSAKRLTSIKDQVSAKVNDQSKGESSHDASATNQKKGMKSHDTSSTNHSESLVSADKGSLNSDVGLQAVTIPDVESVPVCVVHVVDPQEFYIQLATKEIAELLKELMNAVAAYYQEKTPTRFYPAIGKLCCAKFSLDQDWYRAVVIDITASKVKVQFVDFGNYDEIPVADIQPLDEKFMTTPMLAIPCTLSGICGTLENKQWSDDAVHSFTTKVLNKMSSLKVLEKNADQVYEVELYDLSCGDELSINQELINTQLAVKKSLHVSVERILADTIPTLTLPSIGEFPVIVHVVINPDEMYCQVGTTENIKQFFLQSDEMNEFHNSQQIKTSYKPGVGELCSAQFSVDKSWCRAEVLGIQSDAFLIKYVDFGNQEKVPQTAVRQTKKQYSILPKQANKCAVAGIKPKNGSWNDAATEELKSLTGMGTKILYGTVVEQCGDVTVIELIDKSTSDRVVISDKLVETGLAAWKVMSVHSDNMSQGAGDVRKEVGPEIAASEDIGGGGDVGLQVEELVRQEGQGREKSMMELLLKENAMIKEQLQQQSKQIQQIMKMLTKLGDGKN